MYPASNLGVGCDSDELLEELWGAAPPVSIQGGERVAPRALGTRLRFHRAQAARALGAELDGLRA